MVTGELQWWESCGVRRVVVVRELWCWGKRGVGGNCCGGRAVLLERKEKFRCVQQNEFGKSGNYFNRFSLVHLCLLFCQLYRPEQ